jgi:hypothetical protein
MRGTLAAAGRTLFALTTALFRMKSLKTRTADAVL